MSYSYPMHFDVLTLFPEVFAPYTTTSILGRAQTAGYLTITPHNIRDYAVDKHHTTDDTPYGGGAGMVMKIEPIDKCLDAIAMSKVKSQKSKVVVLSARGRQFTQAKATEYAQLDHLILICGRYEGIDQRVIDHLADEEISIGPYVLSGGELPAMVVIEAIARLIPGVLGNPDSLAEESHQDSLPLSKGEIKRGSTRKYPTSTLPFEKGGRLLEYPHYTKPEEYKGWGVPPVLLSGNHAEIRKWREEQRSNKNLQ